MLGRQNKVGGHSMLALPRASSYLNFTYKGSPSNPPLYARDAVYPTMGGNPPQPPKTLFLREWPFLIPQSPRFARGLIIHEDRSKLDELTSEPGNSLNLAARTLFSLVLCTSVWSCLAVALQLHILLLELRESRWPDA